MPARMAGFACQFPYHYLPLAAAFIFVRVITTLNPVCIGYIDIRVKIIEDKKIAYLSGLLSGSAGWLPLVIAPEIPQGTLCK
ncbi:MAG: hypothetical protein K4571_08415 [Deltaproteobacteria bacterium]